MGQIVPVIIMSGKMGPVGPFFCYKGQNGYNWTNLGPEPKNGSTWTICNPDLKNGSNGSSCCHKE